MHGPTTAEHHVFPKPSSTSKYSTLQMTSSEINLTFLKVSLAKPGEQNYEIIEERARGLAWLGQQEATLFIFQVQGFPDSFLLLPFFNLITRENAL